LLSQARLWAKTYSSFSWGKTLTSTPGRTFRQGSSSRLSKAAQAANDRFITRNQIKFPKACKCLEKDKEVLFTFYDFPVQYALGTTNPIESTFATGCERDRTEDFELIPKVVTGVRFVNGRLVSNFNKDVPTL